MVLLPCSAFLFALLRGRRGARSFVRQQGDRIFLLKRKQEAEHWCCTSVGRIRLASPARRVLATNTGEFRREKAIILRRAQCSRSIAYCCYLFASPKRKKQESHQQNTMHYKELRGAPGGRGRGRSVKTRCISYTKPPTWPLCRASTSAYQLV